MRGRVFDDVKDGANLMTDEHASYQRLQGPYKVHSVNHSAGEYVRDFFCHTNGIEGAWSLHHHVSAKHLDAYLGEMCYRYNRRDIGEGERVNDLLSQVPDLRH